MSSGAGKVSCGGELEIPGGSEDANTAEAPDSGKVCGCEELLPPPAEPPAADDPAALLSACARSLSLRINPSNVS